MKLAKYIGIGVLACAAFVTGFALFSSLIHADKTFADGFKSIFDWFLGVLFGISIAYSAWKKDNKGNDKKE